VYISSLQTKTRCRVHRQHSTGIHVALYIANRWNPYTASCT